MKTNFLVCAVVMSFLSSQKTVAANLLVNGSFQSASGGVPTDWTLDPYGGVYRHPAYGQDDTFCAAMLDIVPNTHPQADWLSQSISVTKGSVYRVSWWRESEGYSNYGNQTNISLRITCGDTTSVGSIHQLTDPHWHQFIQDFTAKDNTATIRFTASNSNYLTADLDNVSAEFLGAPALSLTGSTNFGNVLVGQTASQTLGIRNSGYVGSTLTVNAASASSPISFSWGGFDVSGGNTQNQTVSWSPITRGNVLNQAVGVTTTVGFSSKTYTGASVAPLAVVGAQGGVARVGTQGTATISVTNVGDGNSAPKSLGVIDGVGGRALNDLWYSVPAISGAFVGNGSGGDTSLGEASGTSTFSYSFTGTSRGMVGQNVSVSVYNGTGSSNSASTVSQSLTGELIGPVFSSNVNPGDSIDFGDVGLGQTAMRTLSVSNLTTDTGIADQLELTLRGYDIIGPNAAAFKVTDFVPGTILGKDDLMSFPVQFTPGMKSGAMTATLWIHTDQDAALGQAGLDFQFPLLGTVAEVGDANGDCAVGAADYALWAAQFGITSVGLSADFDGNGSVGAGDYALWAANFGNSCVFPAAAVPEPASGWLLGLAAALLLRRWRRAASGR